MFENIDNAIVRNKLALLAPYIKKEYEDVCINRPGEVVIEKIDGSWEYIHDPKLSLTALLRIAQVMATVTRQRFDINKPSLSFMMPGGHRVQIVAGSSTEHKFTTSIRINREITYNLKNFGFLDEEIALITAAIKNKKTLLLSGATSTGKTSCLNTLLNLMNREERIITLEGVQELKPPHRNHVSLLYSENESSIGNLNPKELLNVAMRMRPDRIILGEILKANAFVFAESINTGHEGGIATIHANDPDSAIEKIISYAVMNNDINGDSIISMRRQLLQNIYGVIQLRRDDNNHSRSGYFKVLSNATSPTMQFSEIPAFAYANNA